MSELMSDLIWIVAITLFLLWGVGLATSSTLGGFIHVLLVVAIISVLVRLILGKRTV